MEQPTLILSFCVLLLLPVACEVSSRKESVKIMEINLTTLPSTGDYSSCVSNESERTVEGVAEAQLPTELGEFRLIG